MTEEEYDHMIWLETKQDRSTITLEESEILSDLRDMWFTNSFSKNKKDHSNG